jgi:hypothetical protein
MMILKLINIRNNYTTWDIINNSNKLIVVLLDHDNVSQTEYVKYFKSQINNEGWD